MIDERPDLENNIFEELEPWHYYNEQGVYFWKKHRDKKVENIDWALKKIEKKLQKR